MSHMEKLEVRDGNDILTAESGYENVTLSIEPMLDQGAVVYLDAAAARALHTWLGTWLNRSDTQPR